MNFLRNIPTSNWLFLIIIFGFGLRAINLTVGFPILYISNDEAIYHLSALNMIANKTPFTIGNYGPLGSYLQIPFLMLVYLIFLITDKVQNVSDFEFLIVTHEGYFLFIPRIISALFGTLTIIAVYLLSKEIFGRRDVAIFSAILASVSFNLVHISHLARSWSPAIFFAILAVLFAVRAVQNRDKYQKLVILSGILCAISFGFHQFGALAAILIGLILSGAKVKFSDFARKTLPGAFIFITLVMLFNYLSLGSNLFRVLNPNYTGDSVELVILAANFSTIYQNALLFLKNLFLTDHVIIVLFVIFLLKSLKKQRLLVAFAIFITFNLLFAILVFPPFVVRYFFIAFAFLPIFAGFILGEIFRKTGSLAITLIIILAASFNSVYFDLLISREGTYNQVRNWLDDYVAFSTPIIATSHRNLGYVPNSLGTSEIRKIKEGYYLRAANLLGTGYADNVRFIVYANQFGSSGENKVDYTLKALKQYDSKIIVDSYLSAPDSLLNTKSGLNLRLLAHFSPTDGQIWQKSIPEAFFDSATVFPLFALKRPGPYFDVLEIID